MMSLCGLKERNLIKMEKIEKMKEDLKNILSERRYIHSVGVMEMCGKIGADIEKKKYGLDKQIEDAIKYHTNTNIKMDTLAKILYVSDKIEMNRMSDEYNIQEEREVAKKDLDRAVLMIIDSNIESLIKKGKLIEQESIETRNKILIEMLKKH